MIQDKVYFRNLDSIRFIAALMVFLGHAFYEPFEFLHLKGTFIGRVLYAITDSRSGVSIFFVLSGFLITYLLVREYDLTGKILLKNFYLRRMLRIWPLFYAVVLFTFFIYPGIKTVLGINIPLASNVWYHLTFLSNLDVINVSRYFPGSGAGSQSITWSVSVEEQFYVFWPLIFFFLPKKFWAWIIATLIIGSIVFRIVYRHDHTMLYFHSLSVLPDLCIGGIVALMVLRVRSIRTYFESRNTKSLAVFLGLAVLAIFFSDEINSTPIGEALGRIFISCTFALVIVSQAINKSESRLNLCNWNYADRLGKYTYAIYLLHPIAILFADILMRFMPIEKGALSLTIVAILAYPLTILMSKLSYRYFESPFLRIKDRFAIITK